MKRYKIPKGSLAYYYKFAEDIDAFIPSEPTVRDVYYDATDVVRKLSNGLMFKLPTNSRNIPYVGFSDMFIQ